MPLDHLPLFRRVGSVIPLHVARRYTGDDFGLPLERMMDATAAVLHGAGASPSVARTSAVPPHPLAPAPVRVLLWTHPLLVDAAADLVHTTVRDDYGPGLAVDARFAAATQTGARALRLALSAHPRPTAVVVTGWTAALAATRVELVADDCADACAPLPDGRAAVTAADDAFPTRPLAPATSVAALGGAAAFAVDEAHARLVVWLDSATLARGAVLRLVAVDV